MCGSLVDRTRESGMYSVHLGLGSNLGDREKSLYEALDRISGLGLSTINCSSIYETEPVGYSEQPWFLNQAIEISSTRETSEKVAELHRLLGSLQRIEAEMGRRRVIATGPRLIDIDLLLAGNVVIGWEGRTSADDIVVPHPRLHERRFVLVPLCEIAPTAIHPVFEVSIDHLAGVVEDRAAVRVYRKASSLMRFMS